MKTNVYVDDYCPLINSNTWQLVSKWGANVEAEGHWEGVH